MAEVETEVVANVSSSRTMAGYFMLPSVTPSTKTRWNIRKTTITGSTTPAAGGLALSGRFTGGHDEGQPTRPLPVPGQFLRPL